MTGRVSTGLSAAKIPWRPITAVLLAVSLYFLAQIGSSVVIQSLPEFWGWSGDRAEAWLSSNFAQFLYILLAEVITIGVIVWFVRRHKRKLSDIGVKRPRWRDVGYGLAAYVPYVLLLILLITVVTPFIDVSQEQELGFEATRTFWQLALIFVSLVLLPPLTEELMMRGFVFTSLRSRMSFLSTTLITSVLFAIAHLAGGAQGSGPLYVAAVDTFVLSLLLCYVREKTGSIWACVVLHALKNGIAFAGLFIFATL